MRIGPIATTGRCSRPPARGMQPAVILTFSARSFLYLMARPDSEIARYLRRIYLER